MGIDAGTEAPISARRAQTRDRLMAAARVVFAEHGVEAASVEEICDAAGFTRGAFYSNFGDRSALVLAMIQQSISFQFAAAERAIATMKAAGDRDPQELIEVALSSLSLSGAALGTADADVVCDRAMMLHAARTPELHEPYLAFVDACAERVGVLVTDALTHAGLQLTVPVPAATELLIAAHNHLQTLGLFDTPRADPALLDTLLRAITRPRQRPTGDVPDQAAAPD